MKTIVKNYIDLFIKQGYITEKNNLIRLSFDRRKSVELEVIKIKKYKDDITYKINVTDYDKKYKDIDIMSLPVTNPYIDYIDEESCKHKLSKITIHDDDDDDDVMIKPSLKKIEDECIFNARPHSESICYGSGDVCIYGGALYRQCDGALTHGRFNPATWQQIYPMSWMIMLSCKELPKIYTDSFFYKEDIITSELYHTLCNEGNTIISGYKYNESLDYIKNNYNDICMKYHVIKASSEALLCMILDYITLTPIRSTEIRRSEFGNFYVIENHSILTNK